MAEPRKSSAPLQEIKVRGTQIVDKVREIIEEGNARRIIIKKDGRSVMELPLSLGVGAASAAILLNPYLAAIGAFASLVSDISIAVETHTEMPDVPPTPTARISDVTTPAPGSPMEPPGTPPGPSTLP